MSMPKYRMIEEALIQELREQKFKEGDMFYTGVELMEKFDVSLITVKRAIDELVKKDLVYKVQGKGTFVSKRKRNRLVEITEKEKNLSNTESTKTLSIIKSKDVEITQQFKLRKEDCVYEIDRLRYSDNTISNFQKTYIHSGYLRSNEIPSIEKLDSIYVTIRETKNLDFFNAEFEEIIEVSNNVDIDIYHKMQITPGTPLVVIRRYTYIDGDIAEHVISYKNIDFFRLKIRSHDCR